MPNRFSGKTCVLCSQPSVGVGEHVIPSWYLSDLLGDAPFKSENAGHEYLKRDGNLAVQLSLPGTHVPMCLNCNSQMNANIEAPAKPVIRKLVPMSASHMWPTISSVEAAAVGKWLLKVGLLWFHPEAKHDQPQVQQDPNLRRFTYVEPEWLTWMTQGNDPPVDFSVFVSRHDPRPWSGSTRLIELPELVRVGGRELRFMSREIGIRGLDATIVWHPGWPIAHPLVTEGRAAVLWPNPKAIDFAPLSEVSPAEFQFSSFPGIQKAAEDVYPRWTASHPLAEGVSPLISG